MLQPTRMPGRGACRLALGAAILLLTGCASMGSQSTPARLNVDAAAHSTRALSAQTLPAPAPASWPVQEWWRAYGDPQLDRLVDGARDASPTIAAALARVRQAAALEGLAAAALAPQASATAHPVRQRYSDNGSVPKPLAGSWQWANDLGVNLGYELDFWGKNAAGVAAAAGRVNARQAEAQAARLAVAGAVVQAYLQLDHLYTRRDLAEQELRQRTRIADLVRQRVAAQLDSRAELRQAEIGVPSARGEIAALDEALALTRGQLAARSGQGQDPGATIARPHLATARPAGVPEDIPAARAALNAARRQMDAARALVDGTTLEQHPDVLSSIAGLRDASLGLARTTLAAPVGGTVARRNVQIGQRVAQGAPLMAIVPLDQMWVTANLKETQLKDVRIGQPVAVTSDVYGADVVFHGRVVGQEAGTGSAFAAVPARRTRPATGSRSCSACRCALHSTRRNWRAIRCAWACR